MNNEPSLKSIKIFGERNSGTNFLKYLLERNVKDINIYSTHFLGGTGWKHGFPRIRLFKKLNSTLFIFIIRDLESWVKSMYFNPYSYKTPNNINDFLTKKLIINDRRRFHDVNIFKLEQQNVINLRYLKIKSYLYFYNFIKNAVFINLEDLQNNNQKFLTFLKEKYNLNIGKYVPITKHTKKKIRKKNRDYNLTIPKIKNKNNEFEKFVEDLKSNYYFKSIYSDK